MGKIGERLLRNVREARAAMGRAADAAATGRAADLAGALAAEGFAVHVPATVDVRAIRRRLGLSQGAFAARFGFALDAVQNWEQGRRRPEGAARAFLTVIEREPEAVTRALAALPTGPMAAHPGGAS
jgi:putative transcriptional regulator